ncbi:MAG: hypothetical protein ABII72_01245 [Parcubacteria group bacterium]
MAWINMNKRKKKLFRRKSRRGTFNEKKSKLWSKQKLRSDLYYRDRASQRKKREWLSSTLKKVYLLVSIGTLSFLIYFLFFTNFFRVNKIILIDNVEVSQTEVEKVFDKFRERKRLWILPADNIFLLNKDDLNKFLIAEIPRLEQVEIEKKLTDMVKVKTKERQLLLVWVAGNELHYVDQYGSVCCRATLDEVVERDLPLVYDSNDREVYLREEVVTRNFVGFLQDLHQKFPQQVDAEIKKFWAPSILAKEVHLETEAGWRVYFSIDRSVESQLGDLKIVMDEQIKTRIERVDYIDLRIDNWAYYKYKE